MKDEKDLMELGKSFERCGKELDVREFAKRERKTLEKKLRKKKLLTDREEKWFSAFKFRAIGAIMQGDAVNIKKIKKKKLEELKWIKH